MGSPERIAGPRDPRRPITGRSVAIGAQRGRTRTRSARSGSVPTRARHVVPDRRRGAAPDHAAVHPARVARGRAPALERRLPGLLEPHLRLRPGGLGALSLRQRTPALLPGQGRALHRTGGRSGHSRRRSDPRVPRRARGGEGVRTRGGGGAAGQVRRDLPGGHGLARSRPLADDRQDRSRPRGARDRLPPDPGRAVGRSGPPALSLTSSRGWFPARRCRWSPASRWT